MESEKVCPGSSYECYGEGGLLRTHRVLRAPMYCTLTASSIMRPVLGIAKVSG